MPLGTRGNGLPASALKLFLWRYTKSPKCSGPVFFRNAQDTWMSPHVGNPVRNTNLKYIGLRPWCDTTEEAGLCIKRRFSQ